MGPEIKLGGMRAALNSSDMSENKCGFWMITFKGIIDLIQTEMGYGWNY